MNARERAREAAYEVRMKASRGESIDSTPEGYADVASDVWEPIVRDVIQFLVFTRGKMEALQIGTAELETLLKQLRAEVRRG